jgi:hypothetical protein
MTTPIQVATGRHARGVSYTIKLGLRVPTCLHLLGLLWCHPLPVDWPSAHTLAVQ